MERVIEPASASSRNLDARSESDLAERDPRELACWSEWSYQPGSDAAAEALQDAADAVREGALWLEAARAPWEHWPPFARYEAQVGKGRDIPDPEERYAMRYAVRDIRAMLDWSSAELRTRLAELSSEQPAVLFPGAVAVGLPELTVQNTIGCSWRSALEFPVGGV